MAKSEKPSIQGEYANAEKPTKAELRKLKKEEKKKIKDEKKRLKSEKKSKKGDKESVAKPEKGDTGTPVELTYMEYLKLGKKQDVVEVMQKATVKDDRQPTPGYTLHVYEKHATFSHSKAAKRKPAIKKFIYADVERILPYETKLTVAVGLQSGKTTSVILIGFADAQGFLTFVRSLATARGCTLETGRVSALDDGSPTKHIDSADDLTSGSFSSSDRGSLTRLKPTGTTKSGPNGLATSYILYDIESELGLIPTDVHESAGPKRAGFSIDGDGETSETLSQRHCPCCVRNNPRWGRQNSAPARPGNHVQLASPSISSSDDSMTPLPRVPQRQHRQNSRRKPQPPRKFAPHPTRFSPSEFSETSSNFDAIASTVNYQSDVSTVRPSAYRHYSDRHHTAPRGGFLRQKAVMSAPLERTHSKPGIEELQRLKRGNSKRRSFRRYSQEKILDANSSSSGYTSDTVQTSGLELTVDPRSSSYYIHNRSRVVTGHLRREPYPRQGALRQGSFRHNFKG